MTCMRQRAHEPGVLGLRDEARRQHEPALGVTPAHERLDAVRPAPVQVDLGLEDERELALVHRAAQAGHELERVGAAARSGRRLAPGARPWPRTSRRRRPAAASRRPRRRRGCVAMPTDAPISRSTPETENVRCSASRIFSATSAGAGGRASGSSTANSSPPSRATVSLERRTALIRGPIWRSSSSPWWWPSVSLTSLNRSRSSSITTGRRAVAARGDERALDAVGEERAVRQAGQDVVQRLAAGRRAARAEAERGSHGDGDGHEDERWRGRIHSPSLATPDVMDVERGRLDGCPGLGSPQLGSPARRTFRGMRPAAAFGEEDAHPRRAGDDDVDPDELGGQVELVLGEPDRRPGWRRAGRATVSARRRSAGRRRAGGR